MHIADILDNPSYTNSNPRHPAVGSLRSSMTASMDSTTLARIFRCDTVINPALTFNSVDKHFDSTDKTLYHS